MNCTTRRGDPIVRITLLPRAGKLEDPSQGTGADRG